MARAFDLIPAIDLRGGRVVRLEQGDFERETAFGAEPRESAAAFVASGARWLHVVDLDGAQRGVPVQLAALSQIAAAVGETASVEAAGGIRSAADVEAVLEAGARRIVFGTAALRDPDLVRENVTAHGPEAVAVAVDVRAGNAVGDAWRPGATGVPPDELIARLADHGVRTFEVTAIDRDGLLGGPDLHLLERLVSLDRGGVIASGGIRSLEDVLAVRELGCEGAIVGRAIYDGSFDLAAAITALATG